MGSKNLRSANYRFIVYLDIFRFTVTYFISESTNSIN